MARRRTLEQLEFRPDEVSSVLDWMDRLAKSRDGWVNLLPGVPEEEVEQPGQGIFSALFGSAQPPVSMCTWMPARGSTARHGDEETVGIVHPKGRFAISQLSSMGAPLPSTWRVRQDHARRGLIVHPEVGSAHSDVLGWMLRAGAALAVVPLTGTWQARIYLPRRPD